MRNWSRIEKLNKFGLSKTRRCDFKCETFWKSRCWQNQVPKSLYEYTEMHFEFLFMLSTRTILVRIYRTETISILVLKQSYDQDFEKRSSFFRIRFHPGWPGIVSLTCWVHGVPLEEGVDEKNRRRCFTVFTEVVYTVLNRSLVHFICNLPKETTR